MPRRVVRSADPATEQTAVALPDTSRVAEIVGDLAADGSLIAALQRLQKEFGYLPEPVIDELARLTGIPPSRIYGVVTFYAQFSTVPSGRHKVFVCHGTACHVAGAERITEALEQELDVEDGETTRDMQFALGSVACMGACSQAPVMRIDEDTYGNLTADQTRKVIRRVVSDMGLETRDPGASAGRERSPENQDG